MPRRIELADVADGITGHVIRDTPWDPVWPMSPVVGAIRDGFGREYRFDLIAGEVDPASRYLGPMAAVLRDDFQRHLAARHLSVDWVKSAELVVSVEVPRPNAVRGKVTCRVAILDDLGREYTSTRRAETDLARTTFAGRLLDRLKPSR